MQGILDDDCNEFLTVLRENIFRNILGEIMFFEIFWAIVFSRENIFRNILGDRMRLPKPRGVNVLAARTVRRGRFGGKIARCRSRSATLHDIHAMYDMRVAEQQQFCAF